MHAAALKLSLFVKWIFIHLRGTCVFFFLASFRLMSFVCPLHSPATVDFLKLSLFLFCTGVYPVNNVAIVSGGQQRDSAPCGIHAVVLLQTPVPSGCPHGHRQVPVLDNESLLLLQFKHGSVYMSTPSSLGIPSSHPSHLVTVNLCSTSVRVLFLPPSMF